MELKEWADMDMEAGQSKTSGGRQAGDQEGAKLQAAGRIPSCFAWG